MLSILPQHIAKKVREDSRIALLNNENKVKVKPFKWEIFCGVMAKVDMSIFQVLGTIVNISS